MTAPARPCPEGTEGHAVAAMRPRRRHALRCPHCRANATIRSSVEAAPTLTLIYPTCDNPACSHSWRASIVFDFTLGPSAIPNPALDLPVRQPSRQAVMEAMAQASADPDQPEPPPGPAFDSG